MSRFLDRAEEWAQEQRDAGGRYEPEYDAEVDYDYDPAPSGRWVPDRQRVMVGATEVAHVVEYTTWAPAWEPSTNWARLVEVTMVDGTSRVVSPDGIEITHRKWVSDA